MKTISLELRKRDVSGTWMRILVDLTELNEILTREEIFAIEHKINEIPAVCAHISIIEETEEQYRRRTGRL